MTKNHSHRLATTAKQSFWRVLVCVAGVLATATMVSAAPTVFNGGGDFNNPAVWNDGLPGENGNFNAVIQSFTATTTDDYTNADGDPLNFDHNLVVRGTAGVLNLQHNLETSATAGNRAGRLLLSTNPGSVAPVNHTAGTLTTGEVSIGNETAAVASSVYTISGNAAINATDIQIRNSGQLVISGDGVSINLTDDFHIGHLNPAGTGTLDYIFGATGASTVDTVDLLIDSGAFLNIDGSAFTGGEGFYDLVTFSGGRTGQFTDSNISITGFDVASAPGLGDPIYFVGYDSDSMYLRIAFLPEPSTVMLLGLGGVLLVRARKKLRRA